ncbi:unnamed protein product [Trichobilharzia szidati]|nr:unnamed protein product [Trichobilharzia szidati]
MSSIVYFKFKANDLKNAIRTRCCLYSTDFDLKLEDVTGKDDELIPKYSNIVVRRVPRLTTESLRKKVVGPEDLTWNELQKNQSATSEASHSSKHLNLADSDLPEEEKIKIMMERSSEVYSESNFTVRAKPYGVPPVAYVCHKCNQPGHWIHNCPGVRDKTGKILDAKSVKRPTGIPQDFLLEVEAGTPGAYLGKSGKYMVPIKDAEAYAQGKKDKRPFSVEENPPYVPQEKTPPKQLTCPLCNKLFNDAVLVSCCGTTFCNECIMGHVFDSQVLGSHKCPNCGEVLADQESSVFENALIRSLVRDWLADETKVVEADVRLPVDIAKINENEKAFVNCRRVLKPKQATINFNSARSTNTDLNQPQNPVKTQTNSSEFNSVVKNEQTLLPLIPSTEIPKTTNSVTLSTSVVSSFHSVRVSELTDSSVKTNNTNATVVTSSPCTTLVGTNRQNLLPTTCLSNTQIPCLSYTSPATIMPNLLPDVNGVDNPLFNALYNIRLDDLQAPLATQSTVLPASYGSLVGGPGWTAEKALAVSAAQGAGLVGPVLQVNNNQVAFGLVPGQSVTGTMHSAIPVPVETLNGHKMLSKEEFYRLKMEVLHSARRRHRHRSRSRSPGYAYRTDRLRGDTARHHRGFERSDRERRYRHHSPLDYEAERSRRRHRRADDYDSHRDRSESRRYHYRPTYKQDSSRRRHRSRDYPRSPERRSRQSSRHSPTGGDSWYEYKNRSGSLSPVDPRRCREPHIISDDYDEILPRRKRSRSPTSVVPQYDVSDNESIGPRNPSLPRDIVPKQFVKSGPTDNSEDFSPTSNIKSHEDTSSGELAKQSPTLSHNNNLISGDDCLVGDSAIGNVVSNELFAPEVEVIISKKEKKHKKHKHRHPEKRNFIQVTDDATNQVSVTASGVLSSPDSETPDKKHLKKHKKHKKHRYGEKEKKKKEVTNVDTSVQCMSLDTGDANDLD